MVKILVIDDEYAYRDSLSVLLNQEGFEVRTAQNARESYDLAGSFVPDLLVVDWILRDNVDGIEVAKVIQPINPHMRIIVITGYPTTGLRSRLKDLPSAQYLEKPFQVRDIITAAREIEAVGG